MPFNVAPLVIKGAPLYTTSMVSMRNVISLHRDMISQAPRAPQNTAITPRIVPCTSIGIAEACLLLLADPEWAQVSRYLSDSHCFVIKEGAESVAMVAIKSVRPQVMDIMNVAVRPDRQGRGYGRWLVTSALAHAKQQGAMSVEVSTGDSSLGALALYQRCGFVIKSIDKGYFLRHYKAPIYEEDRQCRSRITLSWVALGYQQGLGR